MISRDGCLLPAFLQFRKHMGFSLVCLKQNKTTKSRLRKSRRPYWRGTSPVHAYLEEIPHQVQWKSLLCKCPQEHSFSNSILSLKILPPPQPHQAIHLTYYRTLRAPQREISVNMTNLSTAPLFPVWKWVEECSAMRGKLYIGACMNHATSISPLVLLRERGSQPLS